MCPAFAVLAFTAVALNQPSIFTDPVKVYQTLHDQAPPRPLKSESPRAEPGQMYFITTRFIKLLTMGDRWLWIFC